jgi:purine-binding chemotaxis protein CheW
MNPLIQLVIFTLEGQSYALELAGVHRVVHAVEVTPLPHAPDVVLGVINVQGDLMAVVNLRHLFRLPEREISLSDQLIIADMPVRGSERRTTRRVALLVDTVTGVNLIEEQSIIAAKEVVSGLEYVQGIAKVADDLILIHDLERCLSLYEERMLDDALNKMSES